MLRHILKFGKVQYSTRGSVKQFHKVWKSFLSYFQRHFVSKNPQIFNRFFLSLSLFLFYLCMSMAYWSQCTHWPLVCNSWFVLCWVNAYVEMSIKRILKSLNNFYIFFPENSKLKIKSSEVKQNLTSSHLGPNNNGNNNNKLFIIITSSTHLDMTFIMFIST